MTKLVKLEDVERILNDSQFRVEVFNRLRALPDARLPAPVDAARKGATLASRVHNAYSRYLRLVHEELEPAIEAIVGEDYLREANTEHDSLHDASVEIVLDGRGPLTAEERDKIKALGFYTVWNDERSGTWRGQAAQLRQRAEDAEALIRSMAEPSGLRYVPHTPRPWRFGIIDRNRGIKPIDMPDDGTGLPLLDDAARRALTQPKETK